MTESELDKVVVYTLRVELVNGKVLFYRIEKDSRNYLLGRLESGSDGFHEGPAARVLWFQTSHQRQVILNCDAIVRVTFLYDYSFLLTDPESYFDNFNVVESETGLEQLPLENGETRLHVVHRAFIPSGVLYHKGIPARDGIYTNPLIYHALEEGTLAGMEIELEGDSPPRQFIHLTDDEGEEGFISFDQVIALEVAGNVLFPDLYHTPAVD